jgi:hypothetical protein
MRVKTQRHPHESLAAHGGSGWKVHVEHGSRPPLSFAPYPTKPMAGAALRVGSGKILTTVGPRSCLTAPIDLY